MDPKFYALPLSSSMSSSSSSSASCSSDPPMPPLSRGSGYPGEVLQPPSDPLILHARQEAMYSERSLHATPFDTPGRENPRLSPKEQSSISTKAVTGVATTVAPPVRPVDSELGFSTDAIHTLTQRLFAHRLSMNACDTTTRSGCPANTVKMPSMSGSASATRPDVPSCNLDRSPLESFLKSLEILKLPNEDSSSASFSTSGQSFLPWSPETVPRGFPRPSTAGSSKWAAPPQSPFFLPPSCNTPSQDVFPRGSQHGISSIHDLTSVTQTFLSGNYSSGKETRQPTELKEPTAPSSTSNSGCSPLITAPERRGSHRESADPLLNAPSDQYPCSFSQNSGATSNALRHELPPNTTHGSSNKPPLPSQVQLQKTGSLACRRLTITSGPQKSLHTGLTGSGNIDSTPSTQPPSSLYRIPSKSNSQPLLSSSPTPSFPSSSRQEEGLDTHMHLRQNSKSRISPPQSPPFRPSSSSNLLQFSNKGFPQPQDATTNGLAPFTPPCSTKPSPSATTHTSATIGRAEQSRAFSMPEPLNATKTEGASGFLHTTASWTQRQPHTRQAHQHHRSMQRQPTSTARPKTPSRQREISGHTNPGSYRGQLVEAQQQISPRTAEPTMSTDSPWRLLDPHNLASRARGRGRQRVRRGHPRVYAADRQRLSYSNAQKAEVCFGCGKPLSVCDCHDVLESSDP